MSELRTDFKDEILQEGEEHRIYSIKRKGTDEIVESDIYLEKAYTPLQEGDEFGAKEVNEINGRLNGLAPQNLLVNGDFKCWQRGTSFTDDYGYAAIYTADMWQISSTGGKTCSAVKVDNGIKIYGQTESRLSQFIPYEYDDLGVASFSFVIDGKLNIHENVSISEEIVGLENNNKRQIALKYHPDKKAILLQFTLKDNQEHVFTYVRCDRGKIAYPHVPEDDATALMRCQQYIKRYITNGNVMYHYLTNKRYLIDVPLDEMAGTPTLSDIVVKWYSDSGRWITGNIIEALQQNRLVTFYVSYDGLLPINQYSLTTECIFTASCEPL